MLHARRMLAHAVTSDSATRWPVARQAALSMGFSRQECWSGLPFLPSGDLLDTGIEPPSPASPALQVDSSLLSHQGSPFHVHYLSIILTTL